MSQAHIQRPGTPSTTRRVLTAVIQAGTVAGLALLGHGLGGVIGVAVGAAVGAILVTHSEEVLALMRVLRRQGASKGQACRRALVALVTHQKTGLFARALL